MKYSTLDYSNEQMQELIALSNWTNFAQRFGGDTRPFESLRHSTDERTLISYSLWRTIYQPHQIIGICFPKHQWAVGFMAQLKMICDTIPKYIRPGIYHTNQTRLEFNNSSRIFAVSNSCHLRGMMVSFAAIHSMTPIMELEEFEHALVPALMANQGTPKIVTFS